MPSGSLVPQEYKRVLLVEDHADTLEMLTKLLQKRGFMVIGVNSKEGAMRVARSHPWDLLITDLQLKDGTGWDLMKALRLERTFPAIAISGMGYDHDLERSREAGFFEHLTKPVDFSTLLSAISRCGSCLSLEANGDYSEGDVRIPPPPGS